MICKYCKSEASYRNKFHTVDCCKKCYDKGKDGYKKIPWNKYKSW